MNIKSFPARQELGHSRCLEESPFKKPSHLFTPITGGQHDRVMRAVPVDGRIRGINNGTEAIGGTASPILSCSVLDLEHEGKLKAPRLELRSSLLCAD